MCSSVLYSWKPNILRSTNYFFLISASTMQGCKTVPFIGSISSYFIFKLTWLNPMHVLIKTVQKLFPHVLTAFEPANLHYACISNSVNKPVPLQLDISFPSFQDAKWSFARLLYLFNIQLERNMST